MSVEILVHNHKYALSELVDSVAEDNSNLPACLKDYESFIESTAAKAGTEDEHNKIKGDMLEILAAVFFERMGDSPRVGLNEYKTIALEEDYGVDGFGINAAGTKVAVQVKYRRNPNDLISYGDMAKTFASGVISHKMDLLGKNSIYLFTNSYGVTVPCREVFGSILKVISRKVLCDYVDNHKRFWANYVKIIHDILTVPSYSLSQSQ